MDMTVIDAGGYDGDGRSELVVMFQRYDHDGYTLFFDKFDRSYRSAGCITRAERAVRQRRTGSSCALVVRVLQ
jgi:hypothetical protein